MNGKTNLWIMTLLWIVYGAANFLVLADYVEFGFDDGTYSHAFLIPFICMYLLWDASRSNSLQPSVSFLYMTLAVFLSISMAISFIAQIAPIFRFLFPTTLIAFTASLFRPNIATLMPPIFVYFMAPIWGVLNTPLQHLSIKAVTAIMRLTSIPTYVEENIVSIPSGTFEIAGGCSGLRYFIVSCAVGLLYCHINLKSLKSCALLMAFSVAGAIVINWLRIVSLVVIGHFTEMQSSLMHDHNLFGWYLYVPFLFVLFRIGRYVEHREASRGSAKDVRKNSAMDDAASGSTKLAHVAIVFVSIAITSTSLASISSIRETPDTTTGTQHLDDVPVPYMPNPSRFSTSQTKLGDRVVLTHRYEFDGRSQSNKATYYLNEMIPVGWTSLATRADATMQFNLLQSSAGAFGVVIHSYGSKPWTTPNKSRYRFYRVLKALMLDRSSSIQWAYIGCDNESQCYRLFDTL